jgi:hypothetical protein
MSRLPYLHSAESSQLDDAISMAQKLFDWTKDAECLLAELLRPLHQTLSVGRAFLGEDKGYFRPSDEPLLRHVQKQMSHLKYLADQLACWIQELRGWREISATYLNAALALQGAALGKSGHKTAEILKDVALVTTVSPRTQNFLNMTSS